MRAPRLPKGIHRTALGYRAFVRVKGFPLQSKSFRLPVDLEDVKAWRERTRASLILDREERLAQAPPADGFRADVARYLPAVKALTSYAERVRDIGVWVPIFGDTPSLEITSLEIQTRRDQWLTVGPRLVQQRGKPKDARWVPVAKPLSASAVNHRLRALSNFFTVLYPKEDNPARQVEEADEGMGVPRSVPYVALRRILTAMSDQGWAPKGQLRDAWSAAKVRAACLAWSGITPKELGRLTSTENRWRENLIVVTPRRKGKGAPGRVIPLTTDGRHAFRDLDRFGLYGAFNVGVINRALALACERAKLPRITCYTFRHSFVTGVVRATKNLQLGGLLAGHLDERTTRRYRLAAEMEVMQDGIAKFHRANRRPTRRKKPTKVTRKVTSR